VKIPGFPVKTGLNPVKITGFSGEDWPESSETAGLSGEAGLKPSEDTGFSSEDRPKSSED
jgi:hypothetical protein